MEPSARASTSLRDDASDQEVRSKSGQSVRDCKVVRTSWAHAEPRRPHEVRGLPDSVLIGPSFDPLHIILVGQQLSPDLAPLQREGSEPLSG